MSTMTMKATARKLADQADIDYQTARQRVSEAVTDLRIERVKYNRNLRSWEIPTASANALVALLAEAMAQ